MAELTPLASPARPGGLDRRRPGGGAGRQSAKRPSGLSSASCNRSPSRQNAPNWSIAAINSAGGDHLATAAAGRPLRRKSGGGNRRIGPGRSRPARQATRAPRPLQLAGRFPGRRACPAVRNLHRPRRSFDALRAYIRVVSLPKQGTDAVRLERLKRAMALARHDEERAYILTAGERRDGRWTRCGSYCPTSIGPALAEPACEAVAELAPSSRAARPEQGRVPGRLGEGAADQQGPADSGDVKRSLDEMHSA